MSRSAVVSHQSCTYCGLLAQYRVVLRGPAWEGVLCEAHFDAIPVHLLVSVVPVELATRTELEK
jgi:hypothetical protein